LGEVIDVRIRGAVAEKSVEIDLIKRGFIPYSPVLENTTCDLVVDVNGRLVKVQVKSSQMVTEGSISFDITRPSAKNPHYNKDDFDVLALYDTFKNEIAYLPWRNLPHKRKITLRYTEETNSNGFVKKYGRLYFDELTEFPSIKEIFSDDEEAIV